MDFVPEFLTFKISYAEFPVILFIHDHSTYDNKQFGGCLIKIKQILSILQRFKKI